MIAGTCNLAGVAEDTSVAVFAVFVVPGFDRPEWRAAFQWADRKKPEAGRTCGCEALVRPTFGSPASISGLGVPDHARRQMPAGPGRQVSRIRCLQSTRHSVASMYPVFDTPTTCVKPYHPSACVLIS
ncbi:hypothetical protein [Kibdelosporangium philippinense]|uniref:hypothetical protein n=1 Tax=Kibdelosporangium philippinense TaxID=211113 RepID=UPI0036083B59